MFVEVTATNSSGVSRPVATPWVQSIGIRSSSPPVPLGILVKSPTPIALLLGRKRAVIRRHDRERPGLKPRPEAVLMLLVPERRRHHAPRRVIPVGIVKILAFIKRQVLNERLPPDPLAILARPPDRLMASSQDVCTTYKGTPAMSAIMIARFVASPSTCGGRE